MTTGKTLNMEQHVVESLVEYRMGISLLREFQEGGSLIIKLAISRRTMAQTVYMAAAMGSTDVTGIV